MRVFREAMLIGAAGLLGTGPAAAAAQTEFVLVWDGQLRIVAHEADTLVELRSADDGSLLNLVERCQDSPSNPVTLPLAGSVLKCATDGSIAGEVRLHVRSMDAIPGGTRPRPVLVWTGHDNKDSPSATWSDHVPARTALSEAHGRRVGTQFIGITPQDYVVIVRVDRDGDGLRDVGDAEDCRIPETVGCPTLEVRHGLASAPQPIRTDLLPHCPTAHTWPSSARPPIWNGDAPCLLADTPEIQAVYNNICTGPNNASETCAETVVSVESLAPCGDAGDPACAPPVVSFLVGRWLVHGGSVRSIIGTEGQVRRDASTMAPAFATDEEGGESGTVFYALVRSSLTVMPTEDDTTIRVVDLSDADDSSPQPVLLRFGEPNRLRCVGGARDGDLCSADAECLVGDPDPCPAGSCTCAGRLSLYATYRWYGGSNETGWSCLAPRTIRGLHVDLTTANDAVPCGPNTENPFDNDIVKILADKPVRVRIGPMADNDAEYLVAAVPDAVAPGRFGTLCYAQWGPPPQDDFHVLALDPDSVVTVQSLGDGSDRCSEFHDYRIGFHGTSLPDVVADPFDATYRAYGGAFPYFGATGWCGELLRIESTGPVVVQCGDMDLFGNDKGWGAFAPYVRLGSTLPPVARWNLQEFALVPPGGSLAFDGSRSFDRDAIGGNPGIVTHAWDFGDGTVALGSQPPPHTFACGPYDVTLTVTDEEGESDQAVGRVRALGFLAAPLVASDKNTLSWGYPQDVSWVRGSLPLSGAYDVEASGTLDGAPTLVIGADLPVAGGGFYYLVKPRPCGSWQAFYGQKPERDEAIP